MMPNCITVAGEIYIPLAQEEKTARGMKEGDDLPRANVAELSHNTGIAYAAVERAPTAKGPTGPKF